MLSPFVRSRRLIPGPVAAGLLATVILATACAPAADNQQTEGTATGTQTSATAQPASQAPTSPAPAPVAAAAPAPTHSHPSRPAPPPKATLRAGSEMEVMLVSEAASDISMAGDAVEGRLVNAVRLDGRTVIPAGTTVEGVISEVKSAKRFGGQAMVSVAWTSVKLPGGGTLAVEGNLAAFAKSEKGKDTAKIAGGAAAGALLGKLLGGSSKDAAVGAVVGGGIGTAVASKRGAEAILPAETTSTVHTLADASLRLS